MWLKNCPRCSGDLYNERDSYGSYVSCAQCGFQRDVTEGSLELASLAGRWLFGDGAPVVEPAAEMGTHAVAAGSRGAGTGS